MKCPNCGHTWNSPPKSKKKWNSENALIYLDTFRGKKFSAWDFKKNWNDPGGNPVVVLQWMRKSGKIRHSGELRTGMWEVV